MSQTPIFDQLVREFHAVDIRYEDFSKSLTSTFNWGIPSPSIEQSRDSSDHLDYFSVKPLSERNGA